MNSTNSTFHPHSLVDDSLLQLAFRTEQFILPCLLLIGTTCNTLTFLVMRRGRMRYSSSCFYMATLAIADTVVLWIGCLNRWLELLDKQRPILACNLCCKLGTFGFFLFADCSVWITVAMTFERYIAVSQPLRASQLCTIGRARCILLLIFAFFFLINLHFLWTFHLSNMEAHCVPLNNQSLFIKYFTWIDSFKYSFCPFTLLITLNVLIIHSLIHSRKNNQCFDEEFAHPKGSKSPSHLTHKALAYRRINRRLTTMLLTVSFAFCICSMPISIMQLIDAIYANVEQRSMRTRKVITIGKIIAEISQYVNHSSNFFLYAITGRIFRHELRCLFTCHNWRFFSPSSSKYLRRRAKKWISHHDPSQVLHEQFYSHGQCRTKILIAPKTLLRPSTPTIDRTSITSSYSVSQALTSRSGNETNGNFLSPNYHLRLTARASVATETSSIGSLESPGLSLQSFDYSMKTEL